MCGRYMLTTPVDALRQLFLFTERPNLPPRYNIAPTQDVPIVRRTRDGDGRELIMVRWGLVPYWADDPKIGNRLINARGESVARTPAFREAYQRRRCLVPADGFFEWRKDGKTQAAAPGPAQGPGAVRLRRAVGALAAAGRRGAALVHDHHLPAQRAGRAGARPHAGDPRARGLRALARPRPGRRTRRCSALPADWLEAVAGEPAGQQPEERRSRVHRAACGAGQPAVRRCRAPVEGQRRFQISRPANSS